MITTITTIFAIPIFALTFWLGSYLVSRGTSNRQLLFAACAFITYSLSIVCTILNGYAPQPAAFVLTIYPLVSLPDLPHSILYNRCFFSSFQATNDTKLSR